MTLKKKRLKTKRLKNEDIKKEEEKGRKRRNGKTAKENLQIKISRACSHIISHKNNMEIIKEHYAQLKRELII
jgi:hypothetical protein